MKPIKFTTFSTSTEFEVWQANNPLSKIIQVQPLINRGEASGEEMTEYPGRILSKSKSTFEFSIFVVYETLSKHEHEAEKIRVQFEKQKLKAEISRMKNYLKGSEKMDEEE